MHRDATLPLRPRAPGALLRLHRPDPYGSYRVLVACRGNHCSSLLRCGSALSQRALAIQRLHLQLDEDEIQTMT